MAEENKTLEQKQLRPNFINESGVQTFFVNIVNVRGGLEEFYLTLGTALPIEVKDVKELEHIDTVDVQPLFRCVVTKSVMRQMIDLMENVYNQQEQRLGMLGQSQRDESEGR
jgi:hypothetical protein